MTTLIATCQGRADRGEFIAGGASTNLFFAAADSGTCSAKYFIVQDSSVRDSSFQDSIVDGGRA